MGGGGEVDTPVSEVESVTCDTLLSGYVSEISSLSQDRALLISENVSIDSKLDSYKSEAAALRERITDENQRNSALESRVSELSIWQSDAISWIQENYSEDTTQPPSSDTDALNARIADLQSEVDSLKQELADKQAALDSALSTVIEVPVTETLVTTQATAITENYSAKIHAVTDWRGFKVTLSTEAQIAQIDNEFSEYDGTWCIGLPVTFENCTEESSFWYNSSVTVYGPDGSQLSRCDVLMNGLDDTQYKKLRPGGVASSTLWYLYAGSGTYWVEVSTSYSKSEEFSFTLE